MKRRGSDPTDHNTGMALDVDGNPLTPTRPSKARRLMQQGPAEKYWRKDVSAIRMMDVGSLDPDIVVECIELNMESGASLTGAGKSCYNTTLICANPFLCQRD